MPPRLKFQPSTRNGPLSYIVKNNISYNRSPLVARGSGSQCFEQMGFDRNDLEKYFHPALRRNPRGYVSYTPFFLSPELRNAPRSGR
jgi:hypothetical protein